MIKPVAILCLLLWVKLTVPQSDVCDASVENCLTDTDTRKYGTEANLAGEEVKESEVVQTAVEKEEAVGNHEEHDEAVKPGAPMDNKYTNMFDENGNFNRELAKDIMSEEEYQDVEEASLPEGEEDVSLYSVQLESTYEENLVGVHSMNKYQQKWAMDEFTAGRLEAGEMGNGVKLEFNKDTMEGIDESTKKDLQFLDHAFNQYLSDIVSVNRSLPDRRDDWCKRPSSYLSSLDQLPPTSIIICFHNEAWSTLLRTIYSVLNRSPSHLVAEILLVDDASTMEHLAGDLDILVEKTDKLRLLRLPFRQGLVRTRMAGIREARAEVLTFLDSHIEATEGWLEPLLDRVARNYKTVACPVIEAVDQNTLQYRFISQDLVGSFNWKLEFDWSPISAAQEEAREHPWAPYNSPTMAGGLFSISKKWFEEIGLYDEGMEIWGGENIEMSFRQWMCGGSIEVVPCSRVGHIFRAWSPYPWRTDINVLTYNPLRVAEVWMDNYRFLYYDRFGRWDKPLAQRIGHFGDVTARRRLREALQCKSFQWYLDHVAVELPQHKLQGSGEIFNPATRMCLDSPDKVADMGSVVTPTLCHMTGGNQYWMFRTDGKIVRDYLCVGRQVSDAGVESVAVLPCEESIAWLYDSTTNLLKYKGTATCLVILQVSDAPDQLGLSECDPQVELQRWKVTHYNPGGMDYTDLA